MKKLVAGVVVLLALVGCQEVKSGTNNWEGWTNQAAYLARHYDEQLGVACYLSTRGGQASSRDNPLSCVKVN